MIQKIVATCDVLVFWDATAVGNSPQFWNESPTDLDNVIIIWWNLVIVRDNSPIFQTTLRGPSDCWVVSSNNDIDMYTTIYVYDFPSRSNNNEISSNDDNIVQVRTRFGPKMGWVADGWDAMLVCNNFARWLQKIVATCDAMCWFSGDATIFCNNFARWLQKIVACETMCWFSRMLRSFVTTLQDDYKR
jgi:hypothetical protein